MNSTYESSPVYLHQYQNQSQAKERVIISYPVAIVNDTDFYSDEVNNDHIESEISNEESSCKLEVKTDRHTGSNAQSAIPVNSSDQIVEYSGIDCVEIPEGNRSVSLIQLPTNVNIVQVASNVLVGSDSLIVCLPPDGMTIQLQSAAELSELGIATSDSLTDGLDHGNKLEKAQSWHRDSQLAVRALLALNTTTHATSVSKSK